MRDKIKLLLFLTIVLVCMKNQVMYGYTGKGTENNPYVVSSESDIESVFASVSSNSKWTYIAVDDVIAFTKTQVVDTGKFRIFAKNANQTIRRSKKMSAKVNSASKPSFCMKVTAGATVVLGYEAGSNFKLLIDGVKDLFVDGRECNGWLYVDGMSSVTIDKNCIVHNAMNTVASDESAPIRVDGILNVNGEIKNCMGINGGAIKSKVGEVYINSSAYIHNCSSDTEGGAIFSEDGALLVIDGGLIDSCTAVEEGGAICSVYSRLEIRSGTISNNTAGATGGGVFSGKRDVLVVGVRGGAGPSIKDNFAYGSGGGVRCNGGSGGVSGGLTYFYGGSIMGNYSSKHGGGISCGEASSLSKSQIIIENTSISGNYGVSTGGGIWIDKSAEGIKTKQVYISKSTISNNGSSSHGGGILTQTSVELEDSKVTGNDSKLSGGGFFVTASGCLKMTSGTIESNKCRNLGSGIYLQGKLQFEKKALVDSSNNVYLEKDTFIDIVGKLDCTSGYIAHIQVDSKQNGRKIVRANYAGTTGENELYYDATSDSEYTNDSVAKKYFVEALGTNQCLRATEKVNGVENGWIIISEKYSISYNANSKNVENLPDNQLKFWNEDQRISGNEVRKPGYSTSDKHWNSLSDGSGQVYKPDSVYSKNESITLYAIWDLIKLSSLQIIAPDRFYVVHQKILLTMGELLKYVEVKDVPETGFPYTIKIRKIINENNEIIASGDNIMNTASFMGTKKPTSYKLILYTQSAGGKTTCKAEMNVYIMDNPNKECGIRFISREYLYTLSSSSKWFGKLNSKLTKSLDKEESEYVWRVKLKKRDVINIRKKLVSGSHRVTDQVKSLITVTKRVEI